MKLKLFVVAQHQGSSSSYNFKMSKWRCFLTEGSVSDPLLLRKKFYADGLAIIGQMQLVNWSKSLETNYKNFELHI